MKFTSRFQIVMNVGLALICSAAGASTECVNPSGTGGCFTSIQDAIDAARNDGEVDVAAGSYSGFTIGYSHPHHVTVRGEGPASTTVIGSVTIDLGGTISGLRIESSSPYAVHVDRGDPDENVIENCEISGGGSDGITADRSGFILVDSVVTAVSVGVRGPVRQDKLAMRILRSNISGGAIGVYLDYSNRVTIDDSTIFSNQIGIQAGSASTFQEDRITLDARDVTISGNSAGGLLAFGRKTKITLTHATIAGNASSSEGAGVRAERGAKIKLRASIVADNTGSSSPECFSLDVDKTKSRIKSGGFNVIENVGACSFRPRSTDVAGMDPLLGPLSDNGGPTLTLAPSAGSVALGLVTSQGFCKDLDQRGNLRIKPCDSGAFELP